MKYVKVVIFFGIFFILGIGFAGGIWVAEVGSKRYDEKDLRDIVGNQKLLMEVGAGRSLDEQFKNKNLQAQILQQYLVQGLMVEEIKKINQTKHFVSEVEIQNTAGKLKSVIENALWLREYVNKVLRPQISVSQKAVKQFYKKNKSKFEEASQEEAYRYIKEDLVLKQVKPLLNQLQAKVTTETNLRFNEKYFQS